MSSFEYPHAVRGEAECHVLLVSIAEASAQNESSSADDVEGRYLLGELDGVEQSRKEDAGADGQVAAFGR